MNSIKEFLTKLETMLDDTAVDSYDIVIFARDEFPCGFAERMTEVEEKPRDYTCDCGCENYLHAPTCNSWITPLFSDADMKG